MHYNKILVIRLSSLGDIILTTPFLKILRDKYPHSRIDYCTKQEYAGVLRHNPNINNLIETENELDFASIRKLKKKIKSENYNLIIDLQNKLNTLYLRIFSTGERLVFRKYSFRKFVLVKLKINLMKKLPSITSRFIKVIGEKRQSEQLPEIYTGPGPGNETVELPDFKNIETICIVPSSKHYTKTYPAELYAELINSFDINKYSFVLIGKGSDKKNIDTIMSKTGRNVFDLSNKLTIVEVLEIMKKSRLVISGDTGPMHIAEAAGVPILLLAGSSVREFGFYPQTNNSIILENNGLKCRPCSHIGRESCPKGHFKCMNEIKPVEIKNAVESMLLI